MKKTLFALSSLFLVNSLFATTYTFTSSDGRSAGFNLDSTKINPSAKCNNVIFTEQKTETYPANFGDGDINNNTGSTLYTIFYRGKEIEGSDGQCEIDRSKEVTRKIESTTCKPLCKAEEKITYLNTACNTANGDSGNYGVVTTITKTVYKNHNKYVNNNQCSIVDTDLSSETSIKNCSSVYVEPQQISEIIQNVCARGGNCSAGMLITLIWDHSSDLDLHVQQPNGQEIYYGHGKKNSNTLPTWSTGVLDVDMNVGTCTTETSTCSPTRPIENISFEQFANVPDGNYVVKVRNYTSRNPGQEKFSIFVAYKKQGENKFSRAAIYDYTGSLASKEKYTIITINKTGDNLRLINIPPEMQINYINGIDSEQRYGNNFL